jgi:hypothetical protein
MASQAGVETFRFRHGRHVSTKVQIRLQAIRKAAVEACVEPELRNAVTGSARHLVPPEVTRVADGVRMLMEKMLLRWARWGKQMRDRSRSATLRVLAIAAPSATKAGFSTVQDRVMNRLKAPYRSCT